MDTIELKVKETPTSEELEISRGKILNIYLKIKSDIFTTIGYDENKVKELNVTRGASDKYLLNGGAIYKIIGEEPVLFPTEEQEIEIDEQGYSLRDRVLNYIKIYGKSLGKKLKIVGDSSYRNEVIGKKLEDIGINLKGSNLKIIEVLETEDNKIFFVCSNKDDSSFGIYPSDK